MRFSPSVIAKRCHLPLQGGGFCMGQLYCIEMDGLSPIFTPDGKPPGDPVRFIRCGGTRRRLLCFQHRNGWFLTVHEFYFLKRQNAFFSPSSGISMSEKSSSSGIVVSVAFSGICLFSISNSSSSSNSSSNSSSR